jgi:hypothetical protein
MEIHSKGFEKKFLKIKFVQKILKNKICSKI